MFPLLMASTVLCLCCWLGPITAEESHPLFGGSSSPLSTASFLPLPLPPGPCPCRGRRNYFLAFQFVGLIFWALWGPRAVVLGLFPFKLLARVPLSSLVGRRFSGLYGALTTELLATFWSLDPPSSLLRGEAALRRLRGFGGGRPPALAVSNDEVHLHFLATGDLLPVLADCFGLPPEGSRPVPMASVRSQAVKYLSDLEVMLASLNVRTEMWLKAPDQP